MKTKIYLALNAKGLVKATKGKSTLARDEIGVMLTLEVPDSAFRYPDIAASLIVPETAVDVPEIEIAVEEPERISPRRRTRVTE